MVHAPISVYIDSKHCELEQCNDSPTFTTKSCKDNGEGMGLFFYANAFNIKRMVGEDNGQHKFWWSCRPWGAGIWRCPRKDSWLLGCPTLAWGRPSAT